MCIDTVNRMLAKKEIYNPEFGCEWKEKSQELLALMTIPEEVQLCANLTPYKYNRGQLYIGSYHLEKPEAESEGETQVVVRLGDGGKELYTKQLRTKGFRFHPENDTFSIDYHQKILNYLSETDLRCEIEPSYFLNIDWFSVTMKGSFLQYDGGGEPKSVQLFDRGEIVLEKDMNRAHGTKHYKHVYTVYMHGEKFGELLCVPRNTAIVDQLLCQFKIENHILYRKGWTIQFEQFMNALGTIVNNVNRLDIALDGHGFMDFHEGFERGLYDKKGKAKCCTYRTGRREITGFDIGSRASNKMLTGYVKGKELEVSNKLYIREAWQRNGLHDLDRVERLELKLKAKAVKQIEEFAIDRLEDSVFLASIMRLQLDNFYEFVENGFDTNVSRREEISPIAWSSLETELLHKSKEVKAPNVLWRLRQRISFDMLEFFAKEEQVAFTLLDQVPYECYTLAKAYGILEWFERKIKFWEKEREFHRLIRKEKATAGTFRTEVY